MTFIAFLTAVLAWEVLKMLLKLAFVAVGAACIRVYEWIDHRDKWGR